MVGRILKNSIHHHAPHVPPFTATPAQPGERSSFGCLMCTDSTSHPLARADAGHAVPGVRQGGSLGDLPTTASTYADRASGLVGPVGRASRAPYGPAPASRARPGPGKAPRRALRGVRARAGGAPGPTPPARTTRTARRPSWGPCGTRTCSLSGARCLGPCGTHTPNKATRTPGVPHEVLLTRQSHRGRPAYASAPRVARAACLKRGL